MLNKIKNDSVYYIYDSKDEELYFLAKDLRFTIDKFQSYFCFYDILEGCAQIFPLKKDKNEINENIFQLSIPYEVENHMLIIEELNLDLFNKKFLPYFFDQDFIDDIDNDDELIDFLKNKFTSYGWK